MNVYEWLSFFHQSLRFHPETESQLEIKLEIWHLLTDDKVTKKVAETVVMAINIEYLT